MLNRKYMDWIFLEGSMHWEIRNNDILEQLYHNIVMSLHFCFLYAAHHFKCQQEYDHFSHRDERYQSLELMGSVW